jgi:SAM-dependent methyltransferase
MSTIIEHYGPSGRVFRFENPDELYPVNRYQSLVLATSSYLEATIYAAELGRSVRNLRAIEFCCGGGSASIMLKAVGLGHVEATDVNPLALHACRNNATLNDVSLDAIASYDLLAPPPTMSRFDIVVCNPPCGSGEQVENTKGVHLRTAIDGGPGGVRFIAPLFHAARNCLVPGGRLVFIITSTMEFRKVQEELDHQFPGRWRLDHTTPVAQPFDRPSAYEWQRFLDLRDRREIFIWEGEDHRLWRLSWVVVASHETANRDVSDRRLWLFPRYSDPPEASYYEALRHFFGDRSF